MKLPQDAEKEEIGTWLEREVAGCQFRDVRHGRSFAPPNAMRQRGATVSTGRGCEWVCFGGVTSRYVST